MHLNADFTLAVTVQAGGLPWVPSPVVGVERRMLDRIGEEVARATSLVRYAPGSQFSRHTHGGGEEFLVLEGVFQDEHGDYPAGTYVRNPPGSAHTPASLGGCVILVKLWQFDPADRTPVVIRPGERQWQDHPGLRRAMLHTDPREAVCLEDWQGGHTARRPLPGGAEVLVLAGTLLCGGEHLPAQTWLRLPAGSTLHATAGEAGCLLWCKTGHLTQTLPFDPAP